MHRETASDFLVRVLVGEVEMVYCIKGSTRIGKLICWYIESV